MAQTGKQTGEQISRQASQFSTVKRVGVIGGGQLAWMMGMAARSLDIELVVQTPGEDDPAVAIADRVIHAAIADAAATAQLATHCDVITFENEFVNLDALSRLAEQGSCFRPRLEALAPLLDKYDQRRYLQSLRLPTPAFSLFEGQLLPSNHRLNDTLHPSPSTLHPSPSTFPIVLKARRHGYDGQGTWVVRDAETLGKLATQLADVPLLMEAFVPFERELAVVTARSLTGEVLTYPLVETQQVNQVCQRVLIPADVSETVRQSAVAIADRLLTALDVVGVFAIELFLTTDGKLLVNEVAPRVHNSGHFSLDACITSQFEQHLRAVCGLPLGDPALKPGYGGAVMVNLLGYETAQSDYLAQRQQIAAIPNAHVYWYGKSESRPGRKLGHVTVLLPDRPNDRPTTDKHYRASEVITQIEAIWYSQRQSS